MNGIKIKNEFLEVDFMKISNDTKGIIEEATQKIEF